MKLINYLNNNNITYKNNNNNFIIIPNNSNQLDYLLNNYEYNEVKKICSKKVFNR